MTTNTPTLGLVLYNDTTDASATFLSWRLAIDGPAISSNFYKIDTAITADRARLTSLEALKVIIPVSATFSSGSLYTATGITAIASYVNDTVIMLSLDITNTGTTTLNINSLGVRSLMKVNTSGTQINLDANDLVANRYYFFRYNLATTSWVWIAATSADQINITGTTGNLVTVNSNTLLGTLTQSLMISQTVHAATTKSTPIDTDELGLIDSASSNVLKRLTWANLKAAINTAWGTLISGSTAKTTPVGADLLGLADSAASFATKALSITNLVAALKTLIATDTLAAPTDITTNNASTSTHGFLPKRSGNISDVFRGDGTYGAIYAPEGFLQNGQINVTVSSNNITVAIKTLAGANPSSTDPVYIRINNNIRTITSALSVTKNAATNWFNSGSSELATKEIDYFVYLGYNSGTSAVVIGFARIPFGRQYSDFSATPTNEQYCAISDITAIASTDYFEVIGRFAATLSATASFNWSVPTFTAINLINYPIYETRTLAWQPIYSAGGSMTYTTVTTTFAKYVIRGNYLKADYVVTGTTGGTASDSIILTTPFASTNTFSSGAGSVSDSGLASSLIVTNASTIVARRYDGANFGLGSGRILRGAVDYQIG